jgi:hypothetical protein
VPVFGAQNPTAERGRAANTNNANIKSDLAATVGASAVSPLFKNPPPGYEYPAADKSPDYVEPSNRGAAPSSSDNNKIRSATASNPYVEPLQLKNNQGNDDGDGDGDYIEPENLTTAQYDISGPSVRSHEYEYDVTSNNNNNKENAEENGDNYEYSPRPIALPVPNGNGRNSKETGDGEFGFINEAPLPEGDLDVAI